MKTHLLTLLSLAALALTGQAQLTDAKQTAAGTIIALRPGSKLAFHATAPVVQRTGSAQTALTNSTGVTLSAANFTLSAGSALSLADSSGGTAALTLAALAGVDGAGSNAAPLTATRNAIATFGSANAVLKTAVEALTSNDAKILRLLNELRDALTAKGLIKGSE